MNTRRWFELHRRRYPNRRSECPGERGGQVVRQIQQRFLHLKKTIFYFLESLHTANITTIPNDKEKRNDKMAI